MKNMITLLTLGLTLASMVGCASAPENDEADAAPAVAAASADIPQSEPIAETPPAQTPAPVLAEPPIAKSPSLGASSSGRGH